MSHYSELESEYTDRDSLVKALVDMGWDQKVIEIHDKAVLLHDGKRLANVVIRKKDMKSYAWTDLGFEKLKNGTYKLHIDEMTMGRDWQGRLKARYEYHDTLRIAKTTGHKLRSEDKLPDGSIRLRLGEDVAVGKHCDTCKCPPPPSKKKIMANFEKARKKCVEVNGTFYPENSKPEIIKALEDARARDVIVQIASGFTEEYPPSEQKSDRPIGEDWLNEGFCVGRVHRTMGPLKSPILVEPGDDGGTIISPDATVRIRERGTGRILYQHPKYHQPTVVRGPVDNVGGHSFKEAVYVDGRIHAQFDKVGGADKWAKEFGWVIS